MQEMKKEKAFTLIELLVVIAIIALLLSVLLPSLKKVRDLGKRAVCLAHLHSLGISWVIYADENDGRITNAKTARIHEIGSSNPRQFWMDWDPLNYHDEPTWVGWWDDGPADDEEAQMACLELGSLYPYNETTKVYRCPAGKKDQWRTSAIVDAMNGYAGFTSVGGIVIKKMTDLRSTGTRMVFIDEGFASTESWTIWPDRIQWWDRVPLRHGDGTTVTMADGHAEYWKWVDQRTIDFANGIGNSVTTAQNNPDFNRLQVAIWGHVAGP
ncbi:MAG: hypothetical protein DRP66_08305 [Planctomycetota bacterium]|nr:MAG: hypothetical protein DRP66_08305 [Planctomycetota bacterium]